MKYLRPFFAIYGAGFVGTFAWLFFALSGTSACASGTQPCGIVVGLTGQLALVWPAYWGARISGEDAMVPLVPIEGAAIAVLAFFIVVLLVQAYRLIGRPATPAERREPQIPPVEPNRRDQSRSLHVAGSAGS